MVSLGHLLPTGDPSLHCVLSITCVASDRHPWRLHAQRGGLPSTSPPSLLPIPCQAAGPSWLLQHLPCLGDQPRTWQWLAAPCAVCLPKDTQNQPGGAAPAEAGPWAGLRVCPTGASRCPEQCWAPRFIPRNLSPAGSGLHLTGPQVLLLTHSSCPHAGLQGLAGSGLRWLH